MSFHTYTTPTSNRTFQDPTASPRSKKGGREGGTENGEMGEAVLPFPPLLPSSGSARRKGGRGGGTLPLTSSGVFPPPSREPKYFSQIKKDASEKEMRERDPPSLLLLRRTQSSRLREIEIMNRARPLREIRESNFLSPPPAKKKIRRFIRRTLSPPAVPRMEFFQRGKGAAVGGMGDCGVGGESINLHLPDSSWPSTVPEERGSLRNRQTELKAASSIFLYREREEGYTERKQSGPCFSPGEKEKNLENPGNLV